MFDPDWSLARCTDGEPHHWQSTDGDRWWVCRKCKRGIDDRDLFTPTPENANAQS